MFSEEVEARETCVRVWSELRSKSGASDRYLDDLASVRKAGLLREYTWIFFRDSGWTEPEGLRLAEFERWQQEELKEHRPVFARLAAAAQREPSANKLLSGRAARAGIEK